MARYLRDLRSNYQGMLNAMESCNTTYDQLLEEHQSLAHQKLQYEIYMQSLKDIIKILKTQKNKYSNTMKCIIEDSVQYAVNKTLVDKTYRVELKPAVFRGQNILKPYLVDEDGKYLPPKTIEGDMLNQVLSFSAVVIISYKNGYHWVFYDEAFSSANVRSLIAIRELIRDYDRMGVNFVIVTQNPILLAGLDRHVIELVAQNGCIARIDQYDVRGSEYDDEYDNALVSLFDSISKGGSVDGLFNKDGNVSASDNGTGIPR